MAIKIVHLAEALLSRGEITSQQYRYIVEARLQDDLLLMKDDGSPTDQAVIVVPANPVKTMLENARFGGLKLNMSNVIIYPPPGTCSMIEGVKIMAEEVRCVFTKMAAISATEPPKIHAVLVGVGIGGSISPGALSWVADVCSNLYVKPCKIYACVSVVIDNGNGDHKRASTSEPMFMLKTDVQMGMLRQRFFERINGDQRITRMISESVRKCSVQQLHLG